MSRVLFKSLRGHVLLMALDQVKKEKEPSARKLAAEKRQREGAMEFIGVAGVGGAASLLVSS